MAIIFPDEVIRKILIHFCFVENFKVSHYGDVIMSVNASKITSLTIVYSSIYSGADQIKHQSSASLAFVRGIHRRVTRKMFPFDIWNSTYNSRQTGHLEYRRARLDLGTSRVQYHAAELWNLLNDVIKNIPCRKHCKRSLCEKKVQGYNG